MSDRPTIVAAAGVFDGVHTGHRHLLDCVRAEADRTGGTTLAVTFDRHPLEVIAPERCPLMLTLPGRRRQLLEALPQADKVAVLHFDGDMRRRTAAGFMRLLRERYGVTHLVMGYDHGFGSDCRGAGTDHYIKAGAQAGVAVSRADRFVLDGTVVSSTAIRTMLADGDTDGAARLLGRPHIIEGQVVSGRRLGRKIGFPTANIDADPRLLLPLPGVYAATVLGRPAVLNIGVCPTVTDGNRMTVEAHIPGFDGDLYGRVLEVETGRRLRDERKFDSLEALRAQLADDVAALDRL